MPRNHKIASIVTAVLKGGYLGVSVSFDNVQTAKPLTEQLYYVSDMFLGQSMIMVCMYILYYVRIYETHIGRY